MLATPQAREAKQTKSNKRIRTKKSMVDIKEDNDFFSLPTSLKDFHTPKVRSKYRILTIQSEPRRPDKDPCVVGSGAWGTMRTA